MRHQVDLYQHNVDYDLQVFQCAHQLTQTGLQAKIQYNVDKADCHHGLSASGHHFDHSLVFSAHLSRDSLPNGDSGSEMFSSVVHEETLVVKGDCKCIASVG